LVIFFFPIVTVAYQVNVYGQYVPTYCATCGQDAITKELNKESQDRLNGIIQRGIDRATTGANSGLTKYDTGKVETFCAPGVNNPERCAKYCKDLKNDGGTHKYCGTGGTVVDTQAIAKKKAELDKKNVEEDAVKKAEEEAKAQAEEEARLLQEKEDGIKTESENLFKEMNNLITTQNNFLQSLESRSKLKIFFIGTDYKNIGQLKSQLKENDAMIKKLNDLLSQAQSEENKNIIRQQLDGLTQENEKINQTITNNENKFSLFGWAIKMINK